VAEGLQLRSRRRPAGFWDNEDALDRELSRFITGAWTQHRVDDDDNQTYFYNQVQPAGDFATMARRASLPSRLIRTHTP
jgi:hypothetical protein